MISRKNSWQIVHIAHLILAEHEVEKYLSIVQELLDAGHREIALALAPKEYPYSKCLLLLLRCLKLVAQYKGSFAVIQSNTEFLKIIEAIHLHDVIRFVASEDELGNETVAPATNPDAAKGGTHNKRESPKDSSD
jgi:hypothetical protein